ncbi:DNA mismatch repair endonuclease MutH [Kangiella sp. TOML190]|uniref:DNA mismatch repair endonuclease MutH n=1 Tax=Kangiella sp. TOML190 TaxID=2931351 RepID=UPI0020412199|nr:DNA mismatch repair endonuclease MutH [Kangiella sp. TOML190]
MKYDSPQALLDKAQILAGFSLGELAQQYQALVPENLLREKGWVGQFLEYLLGAESGSLAQPDFPSIGVEMKTLPIDRQGKPLESTYVSVVPLTNLHQVQWQGSVVQQKLQHVLWVPIIAEKQLPIEQRTLAMPFLWQPSPNEQQTIQNDFEEVIETIAMGRIDTIDARFGDILQVRPKAANSKVVTDSVGRDGEMIKTLPRGFYIRPQFTAKILQQQF